MVLFLSPRLRRNSASGQSSNGSNLRTCTNCSRYISSLSSLKQKDEGTGGGSVIVSVSEKVRARQRETETGTEIKRRVKEEGRARDSRVGEGKTEKEKEANKYIEKTVRGLNKSNNK